MICHVNLKFKILNTTGNVLVEFPRDLYEEINIFEDIKNIAVEQWKKERLGTLFPWGKAKYLQLLLCTTDERQIVKDATDVTQIGFNDEIPQNTETIDIAVVAKQIPTKVKTKMKHLEQVNKYNTVYNGQNFGQVKDTVNETYWRNVLRGNNRMGKSRAKLTKEGKIFNSKYYMERAAI